MRVHCKVKFMEDQYKKSLTAQDGYFLSTKLVPFERRGNDASSPSIKRVTCVSRTGDSVYQSPCNYMKKFVILYGESSARGYFTPRFAGPRRSGQPILILYFSLSLSLSLSCSFFRLPFACERACGRAGMRASNFSLNFVVTNTRCQLSAFGRRGRKRKRPK